MSVDVIVGLQRGDEGKGRFVDLQAENYEIIARGNGGANAGHTVVPEGHERIALHQIPSGIAYQDKLNVIGNGVYLDPVRLVDEISNAEKAGLRITPEKLAISDIASLVLPHHILLDESRESGNRQQGSTKSGIAFVASEKYLREGVRVEDMDDAGALKEIAIEGLAKASNISTGNLPQDIEEKVRQWLGSLESIKQFVTDTVDLVNHKMDEGHQVLAEGAQAYWLDINHGMYPAVTSSSTTTSGLLDGLGISPKRLGKVTGVAKLTKSHVGGGPFVTETTDPGLIESIRGPEGETDSEYGASTGRPRRVGYPDLVELRNATRTNGVDEIILSKMDCAERFGGMISIATAYELNGHFLFMAPSSARELARCTPQYVALPTWPKDAIQQSATYDTVPHQAKTFVDLVENELDTDVSMLGVGPKRNQVISTFAN
jgi:adenylosuccinate synthase